MSKHNRIRYFCRKILTFTASIFLLSFLVFYISRLAPGDPLVSYYGDRVEKMSPKEREWAEERLGLKDSITSQYFRWLGGAVRGDFGISYKYKIFTDFGRILAGSGEDLGKTAWKKFFP